MDACLSILAQPFDARSLHTYDMDLLAYAYGRYERLMRLWEDLFGERIATLEYERLIEDPEAEGARLFADCGLEWNAHYLRVEAGGDAVRTLSAQQARRPLYKTSIGGWRRYADELAPLYAALERELGRVPVSGGA
jgi:hypothetical protein